MQCYYFLEEGDNESLRLALRHSRVTDMAGDSLEMCRRPWIFRVKMPELKHEEKACITGSVPELGMWQPEKCLEMELEPGSDNIYRVEVDLTCQTLKYRYAILNIVNPGTQVIVKSWEGFLKPRVINERDLQDLTAEPDQYGQYLDYQQPDRGWLINESCFQIKLAGDTINIWKPRFATRKYFIKVTPINVSKLSTTVPTNLAEVLEESLSADTDNIEYSKFSFVEVATVQSSNPKFIPQPQFGVEFNTNDMIIYQIPLLHPTSTAYLIDLFTYSSRALENEPPYHAGFSYLLPSAITDSEGELVLPLTTIKHRPLGEIRFEYLVVHPLKLYKCDMGDSYARHWNKSHSGLDVGHRGAGNSFKMETAHCAEVRENTIASMKTAIEHGADLVEFDVQLSKDNIPIIYHDFHVCISMKRKKSVEDEAMLEIPVKDLLFDQLQLLKVYHLMEGKTKQRFFDEDLEEHQPFPMLKQVLEELSPHVGFNIEIKWTMELKDGRMELYHPMELNQYLDLILEVVMLYGEDRRIIFSCFNPDVCTALRLKQNKYPVMFLTQGESQRYPPYKDLRCWSIPLGCKFVQMMELLGINVHTEDLLRDPSLVKHVKDQNLIIFCWGDDNNDQGNIKYLRQLGLHAIIYDKIYKYQDTKKESIFLIEARESEKEMVRQISRDIEDMEPSTEKLTARPQEKVLQVERIREKLPINSTATSLVSLESRMSDFKKS